MSLFRFKQFAVHQSRSAMKVGTDGVLLGAWANGAGAQNMLDVGSGSGLIALMMAQRFQNAEIDAVEMEEEAYEQSLINFSNAPFPKKIQGFHASLQEWLRFSKRTYDLMICNPPYFYKGFPVENEKRKLSRDAAYLQPDLLIKAFINLAGKNGLLSMILPADEGEKFISTAQASEIFCIRKTIVYSKPDRPPIRLLLEFSKLHMEMHFGELIIENNGPHNYTEAYKSLTKDFYLKF